MIKKTEDTKGLVIVYTGEGKGKTTAALGLALRAVGYKKKVLIVQFGKAWFTGELEGAKLLSPYLKIVQGGLGFINLYDDHAPLAKHQDAAQKAFEYLKKEVSANKWDVVIADELVGAIAGKVVKFTQVRQLIKGKPSTLDLVLTGHHAQPNLIKLADLATEMLQIKHPFQKGILAKEAIDY